MALVARAFRRTGVAVAAVALLLRSPHLAPEFSYLLAVCRTTHEGLGPAGAA